MSLFDRIREFFAPGSSLRNRPGGVAYINSGIVRTPGSGIEVLVDCYVVTRRTQATSRSKLSKREVQRLYEPGPVKVVARERV